MKLTLADKLHVSVGLSLFLSVWKASEALYSNFEGIGLAYLSVVVFSFLKEFNDRYGWFKWALADRKTRTGFDRKDWWLTVALPTAIMIGYHLIYK